VSTKVDNKGEKIKMKKKILITMLVLALVLAMGAFLVGCGESSMSTAEFRDLVNEQEGMELSDITVVGDADIFLVTRGTEIVTVTRWGSVRDAQAGYDLITTNELFPAKARVGQFTFWGPQPLIDVLVALL